MTDDDPIAAYLAELGRRLDAGSSDDVLAEAEDHLRETAAAYEAEGQSPSEAAARAIARFGTAAQAAGLLHRTCPRWRSSGLRRAVVIGAAVLVVGAFGGWIGRGQWAPAATTTLNTQTTRTPLPRSLLHALAAEHMLSPGSASVVVSSTMTANGEKNVLVSYTRRHQVCQVSYFARPGSLAWDPSDGLPSRNISCQSAGRLDFQGVLPLTGGSSLHGAFLLSGIIPASATAVAIVDNTGMAHRFSLPRSRVLRTTPPSKPLLADLATLMPSRGVSAVQLFGRHGVVATINYCCGG